jgi:hypothetical protein
MNQRHFSHRIIGDHFDRMELLAEIRFGINVRHTGQGTVPLLSNSLMSEISRITLRDNYNPMYNFLFYLDKGRVYERR